MDRIRMLCLMLTLMDLVLLGIMVFGQGAEQLHRNVYFGQIQKEGSQEEAEPWSIQTSQMQGEYSEKKKIAITFDDGPNGKYTPVLLDGLRERGVVATFFVTGEHAMANPELIRQMQEDGHLIGNHTYSHIQLTSSNLEQFQAELVKTDEVIFELTGRHTEYVRPPYGTWNHQIEEQLNMLPVLWTIDPMDWCCMNAATVTNRVVAKAGENEIILLHDDYETSVQAALYIVDILLKENYEFVTVDEIILE